MLILVAVSSVSLLGKIFSVTKQIFAWTFARGSYYPPVTSMPNRNAPCTRKSWRCEQNCLSESLLAKGYFQSGFWLVGSYITIQANKSENSSSYVERIMYIYMSGEAFDWRLIQVLYRTCCDMTKNLLFCICCLIFAKQWKHDERLCSHGHHK